MKIAILLFGQPRFFDLTKDLIKQEFDFPGHDVHYFAHFWDHLGYIPHGEEASYDTTVLYDNINESLPEVKNVLIQSYDQKDSCSNLKDVCEHMLYFTHKLHSRKIPCGKNINNLYYKFGQHWSMKRCFDRIQHYEAENNFKYDLIIKTRTDIIYKIPECYKTEEDYINAKNDYYFNLNFDVPTVKASALRFLDLTAKRNKTSNDGLNLGLNRFYQNKFQPIRDNSVWLPYVEDYNIRLAFNDWSLVANREGAQIMFDRWFENYFLTLSKDIKNNDFDTSNFFISQSDHCLQGQFLLNFNLQAERMYNRRDVRLLNRDEIKEDVLTDSKILVRPGVTDINYLKYSLIKRWSENIALGRKRSVEFNDTYSFKKM